MDARESFPLYIQGRGPGPPGCKGREKPFLNARVVQLLWYSAMKVWVDKGKAIESSKRQRLNTSTKSVSKHNTQSWLVIQSYEEKEAAVGHTELILESQELPVAEIWMKLKRLTTLWVEPPNRSKVPWNWEESWPPLKRKTKVTQPPAVEQWDQTGRGDRWLKCQVVMWQKSKVYEQETHLHWN